MILDQSNIKQKLTIIEKGQLNALINKKRTICGYALSE